VTQAQSTFRKGRVVDTNGHEAVARLPRAPKRGTLFRLNGQNGKHGYTHHLFRFPAKFHPPIVRWALGSFARKGSQVLDPFTGSGTVQIEALVRGVSSVGLDIDPLACLVATVKTTPLQVHVLRKAWQEIEKGTKLYSRAHDRQQLRGGADISKEQFKEELSGLFAPAIPNITHWFRRYVIVDLARILQTINESSLSSEERRFFHACYAAVIRRVSNADPTPVSGLEVTRIQIERNRLRKINVFEALSAKVGSAIDGAEELWRKVTDNKNCATARVIRGDVLKLGEALKTLPETSLVVTSPPYCQAVEYSRRHRLEMYWLRLVESPEEHCTLANSYIGRHRVRIADADGTAEFGVRRLDQVLRRVEELNVARARTLRHYFQSMKATFAQLGKVLHRNATVVFAVGDSQCCGIPISTTDFIVSLAEEQLSLKNRFSYAIRNHYMQYGLRNGEGIKQENVLVLKRR
jgi:hypothetical protein